MKKFFENSQKEIRLGQILTKHRHKRGITQEELAACMGVSKASVSKWETSTTYPDITLLPQLATFFDISIDELMGYEPQMTRDNIRRLYRQISQDFSSKPFEEVMAHCRELVRKYYSCMPLLFQIGSLYVNHCTFAASPEKTSAVLEEARLIFVRVREESDDMSLISQSVHLEALCLLQLGQPQEVLDLLSSCETIKLSSEPLTAAAWQMLGNPAEAKSILQAGIYQEMLTLVNLMVSYADLCTDDAVVFREAEARIQMLCKTFQLETLHPGIQMSVCITAARGYVLIGDKEHALDLLEQYADLASCQHHALVLHGDSYFSLLDHWLEQNLTLGNALPREDSVIRRCMTEAVTSLPEFASLFGYTRFQTIVRRLESCRKDKENGYETSDYEKNRSHNI